MWQTVWVLEAGTPMTCPSTLDRQALLGEIVHDRQYPEAAAIEQSIGHGHKPPVCLARSTRVVASEER